MFISKKPKLNALKWDFCVNTLLWRCELNHESSSDFSSCGRKLYSLTPQINLYVFFVLRH